MIKGVGIDLMEVERMEQKVSSSPGFRELVFSASEISYCEKCTNKYEHYAARFAAKEAFLKAAGTGWRGDAAFHEIEIVKTELGQPEIELSGKTAEMFDGLHPFKIHVSLTHLKSMAAAMVVIEEI